MGFTPCKMRGEPRGLCARNGGSNGSPAAAVNVQAYVDMVRTVSETYDPNLGYLIHPSKAPYTIPLGCLIHPSKAPYRIHEHAVILRTILF